MSSKSLIYEGQIKTSQENQQARRVAHSPAHHLHFTAKPGGARGLIWFAG